MAFGVGKEIVKDLSVATTIAPQGATADLDGTAVDLLGYESALVIVSVGLVTVGAGGVTQFVTLSSALKAVPTLYEADDTGDESPGTWRVVVAPEIAGTVPDIDDNTKTGKSYAFAYVGSKRWIRVTWDVTGTFTTSPMYPSVVIARGGARKLQTTQGV